MGGGTPPNSKIKKLAWYRSMTISLLQIQNRHRHIYIYIYIYIYVYIEIYMDIGTNIRVDMFCAPWRVFSGLGYMRRRKILSAQP